MNPLAQTFRERKQVSLPAVSQKKDPESGAQRTDSFRRRLFSALLLLPAVMAPLLIGGWAWTAIVAAALLIAAWEFRQLMISTGQLPHLGWIALLICGSLIDVIFPSYHVAEITLAFVPSLALVWQWLVRTSPHPTAEWALTVAGGLYLGWTGRFLLLLRGLPESSGLLWTVTALYVTWGVDAGAYLIGSLWGTHKMAPALSPGKTWEGFLGGVGCGILAGALFGLVFFLGIGHGAILGGLIGSLSPLGDLSLSMMKRDARVKNSGHLIPGHGGMLDRLDSLLWGGMIAYVYIGFILRLA